MSTLQMQSNKHRTENHKENFRNQFTKLIPNLELGKNIYERARGKNIDF
jgi:hypothetical protein